MQERPVVGINGQWPLPVLNWTLGDRIIANVHNSLGNESTSIHWHGFFQNGTSEMDGAPGATQCGIPPGVTFTYNFTINQTGTYWYHSHVKTQYPDGFRQTLVLTGPENPYLGQYDEERVITLSDWYHEEMPTMLTHFISVTNPTGAEPVPKSALMNDTQNLTVSVEPGRTYLFRLVNVGAFASQYFWIEGHTMKIVEVDGVWTDAAETDMIYITSAQRYAVLVTMKNEASTNYPMVGSMDTALFDTLPASLNYNVTGWLIYDPAAPKPAAATVGDFTPYDDFNLVPVDGLTPFPEPDHTVNLNLTMHPLSDGANYAFLNDITYVMPKVPTLYSALTTGPAATKASIYGVNTNGVILNKGDSVDIVLNNDDAGTHPFHLHGHHFQVLARGEENAGHFQPATHVVFPRVPIRRDTVFVRPVSYFVVRFVADNPGVWLFHRHIEWHMDTGLAATMIEAPLDLQKSLNVPEDHYRACKAAGESIAGNAAGNTYDYYNLAGANTPPPPLPAGFTPRGVVALVFSCIAALVGLASIVWYGIAPISSTLDNNTHQSRPIYQTEPVKEPPKDAVSG